MKKQNQAFFLTLIMVLGASHGVAQDAADSIQEIQKRPNRGLTLLQDGPKTAMQQHAEKQGTNLDSTLVGSGKKTAQQNKKQAGLVNRCTQYAHDTATSIQDRYNAMPDWQKNLSKVGTAGVLAGLAYALTVYARGADMPISDAPVNDLGLSSRNPANPTGIFGDSSGSVDAPDLSADLSAGVGHLRSTDS